MARVADVRFFWTRSPSADIATVKAVVTQNGTETVTEFGPEVEEFTLSIPALSSVQFKIESFDSEGNKATSETYGFVLGDLEMPLPATGLGHEVLGTHEVP